VGSGLRRGYTCADEIPGHLGRRLLNGETIVTEGSRKAIIAALIANLGLAVAKFVAFLFTGASSMLAESVHSVADTANQGLLFLGGHRASREPTREHPFGFGRERYFWSFVVALVLFSMGAVFAVYEGAGKLRHPEPLSQPAWAVGVLLIGILLEGYSLRTAVVESREPRGDRGWWAFIRHSKSPELPVVLLEDTGALLGLLLALAGVGLAAWTGDARFDGLASISIGVLLGVIAIVLAGEMKSLLIGESADPRTADAIRARLESHPQVTRLIHMRTQHLGPDELLVAAKLEFSDELSLGELARAIDSVETAVRERVPIARVIYLEPDVHRGADSISG
jgi:cation diffusion facilitator family transporter